MKPHVAYRIAARLLGPVGSVVLVGCAGSPTPPPPPAPTYVFTPAADDLTVTYQGQVVFAVRTAEGAAVAAEFRRGSTLLATGPSYTYAATRVGPDSLRAEVPGAAAGAKDWRILVDAGYGDRPAPVLALTAVIGTRPGTLRVNWQRAAPELNPLPIVRYLVALGHGAPLSDLNWDAAQPLGEVPSLEATVGYGHEYGGLAGGDSVWVGVRAEDAAGRLSPLGTQPRVRIAGAYRITGTVVELGGRPLDGILASVGETPELQALTTGDGAFTLPRPDLNPDGFRDVDRYVLRLRDETTPRDPVTGEGTGRYYDVLTDTLTSSAGYPREFLLVEARTELGDPTLDPACGAVIYGGEFLTFLKRMTNTGTGGNTRLYRWDHYPITYWVQPTTDWLAPGGFAMGPLADAAADAWNAKLGGAFFAPTPDSVAADLKVVFRTADAVYSAYTNIVEPFDAPINSVIPIRMQIRVNRDFQYLAYAQGVVLHEFGHALCIGGHSECGDLHIMKEGAHYVPLTGTATSDRTLADMVAAISADEVRLVLYLRNLPQGINMTQYLLD
ncbi:MAG: zinc metalloprotease [Candidatus Krumholzibacteriia bacterium]